MLSDDKLTCNLARESSGQVNLQVTLRTLPEIPSAQIGLVACAVFSFATLPGDRSNVLPFLPPRSPLTQTASLKYVT